MINNSNIISNYLLSNCAKDKRTIEFFIKDIFANLMENNGLTANSITLKILNIANKENGYIKVLKRKSTYHYFVYINIFNFLNSKDSIKINLFNMYVTILHEFEHIKLIDNKNVLRFLQFTAIIETKKELNKTYFISFIKTLFTHGTYKDQVKRYQSLSSEIWCIYKSIENAYIDMEKLFSDDEKIVIYNMYKGIEIVCNNLEIGYHPNGLPYNKFIDLIKTISSFIKKEANFLEENSFANILFTNLGIKTIEAIYHDNIEKELRDDILLRYFLYVERDYRTIFGENIEMKTYMQKLFNSYCNQVIHYFQNRELCKLFLNTEILEDNEKILVQNVKRVIQCMNSCEMEHIVGGIISE